MDGVFYEKSLEKSCDLFLHTAGPLDNYINFSEAAAAKGADPVSCGG